MSFMYLYVECLINDAGSSTYVTCILVSVYAMKAYGGRWVYNSSYSYCQS